MINNSLFRPSAIRAQRQKFNPEGFDLFTAIQARKAEEKAKQAEANIIPPPPKTKLSTSHITAFSDRQPIEFIPPASPSDAQLVIQAAYRQVFGNAHLMESERQPEAESQLRSGQITVMEFVRQLAKSDQYRTLFFEKCPNLKTVELNFKHLLGRAPESYSELCQHLHLLTEQGLDAEIDSYLDSDEYFQNFGTNIVPYYRGYDSQVGKNLAGFTHSFQLLQGASSSDKSIYLAHPTAPQPSTTIIANQPSPIHPLSTPPKPFVPKPPIPSALDAPFKDLDLTSRTYKSSEFLAKPRAKDVWYQEYQALEAAATFPAARASQPVTFINGASVEDLDILIRSAYKQVFGNVHLMESQRLLTAESKFKEGQFTVKELVRALAQSDAYRALFFERCTNTRTIELNFKHLLGRAPNNRAEISEHIEILTHNGLSAEINTYLDSPEYDSSFGQNTVPYYISYESQTGKNVAGYPRIFQLVKGACSSDRSVGTTIVSSQRSQLQSSVLKTVEIPSPRVFDPQGLRLEKKILDKQSQGPIISAPYIDAFADQQPIEFILESSIQQRQLVLEAAYKQVFGNAYLMESERNPQLDSQLLSGDISVMEFVRQLAKSAQYQERFFNQCSNLKAIELNFKHLLGRAPASYEEISDHINLLATAGRDAEIDSYLDSDEYFQNFGTHIVPFYRGYDSQVGQNLAGFTHTFQLLRGASSSDKSISKAAYTALDESLLSDRHNPITSLFEPQADPSQATSVKAEPIVPIAPYYINSTVGADNSLSADERSHIWQTQSKQQTGSNPIRWVKGSSTQEKELVIRAIYKQVLGNAHLMESERLTAAESQLQSGQISVREFVRTLAKSDRYKSRFFENCPRYRCHELNFKHLLGRAPESYQETFEHSQTLDHQGFDADIDTYLDSQEYQDAFGEETVPYPRGYTTHIGQRLLGYTNMFELLKSNAQSDSGTESKLQKQLMYDTPSGAQRQPAITDTTALVRKVLNLC